jgi:hypothetical protein
VVQLLKKYPSSDIEKGLGPFDFGMSSKLALDWIPILSLLLGVYSDLVNSKSNAYLVRIPTRVHLLPVMTMIIMTRFLGRFSISGTFCAYGCWFLTYEKDS